MSSPTMEVNELPDEHIIVFNMFSAKGSDDVQKVLKQVADFKHKVGGHVYRIIDFTQVASSIAFSDLVQAMALEMNVEGGINDGEVSTIYVGSNEWIQFGAKAFQTQAQYGKTNVIHICGSTDEALAFARKTIANQSNA